MISVVDTHQCVSGHLLAARRLGIALGPGARILDFGCGIGDAVADLLARGFDAFGADITDYWDTALASHWEKRERPPPMVASRLMRISSSPYRLPFPDGYFDFCFSDQVFEHIRDPVPAFGEIARILKPRALSVHRFPAPFNLWEGHIGVPVPYLCRWRPYLALWALSGRRLPSQEGMGWRRVVRENAFMMSAGCFYPSKRRLRSFGREADVEIGFIERETFADLDSGGLASLRRRAERCGLGGLARAVLPVFAQRYMTLRRAIGW